MKITINALRQFPILSEPVFEVPNSEPIGYKAQVRIKPIEYEPSLKFKSLLDGDDFPPAKFVTDVLELQIGQHGNEVFYCISADLITQLAVGIIPQIDIDRQSGLDHWEGH